MLSVGEKKWREIIKDRQRRIETAANRGEIKNIIVAEPTSPIRLVCQEK